MNHLLLIKISIICLALLATTLYVERHLAREESRQEAAAKTIADHEKERAATLKRFTPDTPGTPIKDR